MCETREHTRILSRDVTEYSDSFGLASTRIVC